MKCQVPQISWHSRDPVLSIDFQPIQSDVLRLASGGTDSHVLIWYITYQENKSVKVECASVLYRHNKSVNVVRFSPKGEFLASGDDEGAMFIWELKEREQMIEPPNDDEIVNQEYWYPIKLLRGHLDDIYDICWSKDGNFLVSSSMDNTAIIWDMQKYIKLHIFSDFKGYVQGVTYDPLNQFIASVGSDRTLRIHNIGSKRSAFKISKAPWTNSTEKGTVRAKLFYDDTLQSYFRRLTFTPDGELLIVPSGILEKGEKINNTCYIFSRHALNKPVISLPTGDKYTVAVKCNPFLYKLRGGQDISDKENEPVKPMISLPYRMIFAVAACDSVLLYDTEQLIPFAYVSNIHYTHLTDLSWSPDGLTLVVSSTDGYCSFILFTREELGEVYIPEKPKSVEKEVDQTVEAAKIEKMDISEPSNITGAAETEVKNISAPITPKRSTPVPAKSPKPVSGSKDDSITPSSKGAKIPADNKKIAKKSPKMCSIKKFFMSPNTTSKTVSNDADKTPKPVSAKKDTSASNENVEVIVLSDSPMKKVENSDNSSKLNRSETPKAVPEIEAMDVDNNSVKRECSNKVPVSSNTTTSKKQSKCKLRLEFADKAELTVLMANIDDNASDSNPASCGPTTEGTINELKSAEETENDWRLELSQDDDIALMDVAPSVPESKSNESKTNDLSQKTVPPVVEAPAPVQKPQESKQMPKRRVAFVTLSSKATFNK